MAGHTMLAGIHRSLKDSDTPWHVKLKLARFAWSSSQCFLPNKQQVLLDWVCNSLANQTKFDIGDDTVSTLWQYLHDILKSNQMKTTIESEASVSIRDTIYPVLCDALRIDSKFVAKATACCYVILQSSSLSRALTGKYDVLVNLLSALLKLVAKCLESHNSLQDTAGQCLEILMKKFSSSHRQRQLQAHRKTFIAVYERLLVPAMALYTCENGRSMTAIKGQMEELILIGIFNKDMSEVYTKYLTMEKGSLEGKDKFLEGQFTDVENLVDFLQKEVQSYTKQDCINPVLAGLPVFYRTFIAAYKPTADVKFAMFKKMCNIMGISSNPKDSGIASSPSCDLAQVLPALEQILKDVYNNDVYVVSVNNSEGQPKFQWFLQILQLLLNSASRSSASFFKCLHTLLDLNHLLIEEELTQVWNVSLVHPYKTHMADSTLGDCRTEFLGALMQTYVKLRQFDKLLECLLESFRLHKPNTVDNSEGDNLAHFNPGFVHRFCQCIQDLPPGLTLDLWQLFIDDMKLYIHQIESAATNEEPPKKKKRRSAAADIDKNIEVRLGHAAVTFHLFLTSARVIDLSVIKAMMERMETLIRVTQDFVIEPLFLFCQAAILAKKEVNERVLFATLLLTNAIGELQFILLQHTKYGNKYPKYGNDNIEDEAVQRGRNVLCHTSIIGDFMQIKADKEDILGAFDEVLENKNYVLQHLKHLIRTQQIRAVLLYTPSKDQDVYMKRCSKDVLGRIDMHITDDSDLFNSTWDGQITSVCHDNYHIAYLHLLTQTFSLWLPYVSTEHSNQLARLLVQSFSGSDIPHEDGNMSMCTIARSFLSSDVCMESKELQTELLSAAFTCISTLAESSFSPKKSSKSHTPGTGVKYGYLLSMLTNDAHDADKNWEVLEEVGAEFSTILNDDTCAQRLRSKKMKAVVKKIHNVLNVLEQLPLTHMLPNNQDRCMLGLVVIDAMVTGLLATDDVTYQAELIQALCFCRNLEMVILKAMKSTGLLKCFEVGSMLAYIINKHLHTWECVQETSQVDILSHQFRDLDDVTQMIMKQWIQKAAHRASLQESILINVIQLNVYIQDRLFYHQRAEWKYAGFFLLTHKLIYVVDNMILNSLMDQIEDKLHALIGVVKSSTPSAAVKHLYRTIPLLTTVVTIVQRSTSSQAKDGEDRTNSETEKELYTLLQNLLMSVKIDAVEEVDVLLVSCLAKLGVAMVLCRKNEMQMSLTPDGSSVAMDTDDLTLTESTTKSKKRRKVESAETTNDDDDCELWDRVLVPILHLVLTHIDKMTGMRTRDLVMKGDADQLTEEAVILSACLGYVRTLCDYLASGRRKIDGEMMVKMWSSVSMVMPMEVDDQLKGEILRTASAIMTCMDVDQFSVVLEQSLQLMSFTELSRVSVASVQSCVLTWQVLPDSQLSEEKHKILQDNVPKALASIHCLLVESTRDWSTTGVLALNILTTMNSLMTSTKKLLEPKQAMQTLQACMAVQFTSVPDDHFPSVCSTIYLLLKSLLEAFPQAVMHCMAAYMASLQHMLRGVMRRCHQGSEGAGHIGDQELSACAEYMERLLTQLSSHKKEVCKFVIGLISEYISELQRGTLLPVTKRALVVGVYKLVDVCDEKALALMQATLPLNVKEIYTAFYTDYKKYHKYKGKV